MSGLSVGAKMSKPPRAGRPGDPPALHPASSLFLLQLSLTCLLLAPSAEARDPQIVHYHEVSCGTSSDIMKE
ncbi:hypothetical protein JRQ81_018329 [Phrynocephalus forsythii]|uniref:Uncharacterized protein n=1 Tax=Phrynocephalus forsythii TaxID=171643 RepID=A0A9Q0XSM6_9SAUR|nr:hypothetical protein JRQ81_018329 [Phrynocephalus forsythii]